MHIPENYLSPSTCAVMAVAFAPVLVRSVIKVKKELPAEKISIIGMGVALSFLGMMFNVPMPGGTTGHAVGGTLIALMLGPEAACIAVTMALVIQAFLFGDGGILALGANCFNMAFVLPYVGYGIYKLLKNKNENLAVILGSYLGINAAALLAAIEFGIQPYLFHDDVGNALYCPYGLNISIPAMMIGHLTIFGLAEVIFTFGIHKYLQKVMPISESKSKSKLTPILILILVLILLCPLGLLATGTAWGEWGTDEIAQIVSNGQELGYTPNGMLNGFEFNSLIPDYSIDGISEVVGYYLSAFLGAGISVALFKVLASIKGAKKGEV